MEQHDEHDAVAQKMKQDFLDNLAKLTVIGEYALATLGSKTENGGEVWTASSGIYMGGLRFARVGDEVRYPDGSTSKIASGAGYASVEDGLPHAIVGSTIENGDKIISSLQNDAFITEYAEKRIPGLFDPDFRHASARLV